MNICVQPVLIICLTCWVVGFDANAATVYTTLVSFDGTNGLNPTASLCLGSDKKFYGTTQAGSQAGNYFGNAFRMDSNGNIDVSAYFTTNTGITPFGAFVQNNDGNYYCTASGGSYPSSIVRLNQSGVISAFATFTGTNGSAIWCDLVADEAGNLYGTSSYGGIGYNGLNSQTGYGTVFKVLANGDIITLHSFTGGSDGSNPGYGLTWGMDGNLYGVTAFGGASNNGTIFRISRDGNLTNLHTFNGYNGSRPIHPLCVAQDGHLYGTTYLGGNGYQTPPPFATGAGTVFRISTNGDFSMILQFGGTNGFAPHSKLMAMEDGNLYGTSSEGGATYNAPFSIGDGSIFCLRTNGTLSMVHSFSSSINQGARSPMGGVVQGNDGRLYGTTFVGGVHGYGTVFRISVPMSPILQSPVLTNNNLLLTWSSVAEQTYQLQYTTNLLLPAWFDLGSVTIATNGTMSASDAISGPQRFYRVVVLP